MAPPPPPLFPSVSSTGTHNKTGKLDDGRRGEGAKSYDGEEAWSSVYHSVLSDSAAYNLLKTPSLCKDLYFLAHPVYRIQHVFKLENSKTKFLIKAADSARLDHRVHTEWQLPIFGVYSIMMEKSALAGEGGG